MADTYTLKDTSNDLMTPNDDKDKPVSRGYTESREEVYTIRQLEQQMADCDSQIQSQTDYKAELQAKIAEAEKVLAE